MARAVADAKIANATSETRPVDGILIMLRAAAVGLIRRGWGLSR